MRAHSTVSVARWAILVVVAVLCVSTITAAGAQDLTIEQLSLAQAHRGTLILHRLIVGLLGFAGVVAWYAAGGMSRLRTVAVALACASALYAVWASVQYAVPVSSVIATTAVSIAGIMAVVATGAAPANGMPRLMLAALTMAGCLAVTNFVEFAEWRYDATPSEKGRLGAVNIHDQYHYYLGAKYASEVTYDGLYACTALAAVEMGDQAILARPVRNLRNNELITGDEVIQLAAACRSRFTEERWAAFKNDVDHFLRTGDDLEDERYLTDYGFNATPFWITLNRPFVAGLAASGRSTGAIALIDVVLFAVIAGVARWGFGAAAAALVVFAWGVGAMWVYHNVGLPGSFGRLWWLMFLVAAICTIRRGHFAVAGICLGLAILLRAFPVGFLVLPAAIVAWQVVSRQRVGPDLVWLLGAALGTVALGGAAALVATGGLDHTLAFLANSRKHKSTPLMNYIGLMPLVKMPRLIETAREAQLAQLFSVVRYALVVFWLATVAWWLVNARYMEQGILFLSGGILVVFSIFGITNYDYVIMSFLVLFLISSRRQDKALDLSAFAAMVLCGNVIHWLFLRQEFVAFKADSILVLLFVLWLSWRTGRSGAGELSGEHVRPLRWGTRSI